MVMQKYDDIRTPGIGEVKACEPEVFELCTEDDGSPERWRVALTGKIGRYGYEVEPRIGVERFDGKDMLGVERWSPISFGMLPERAIVAMAMRVLGH